MPQYNFSNIASAQDAAPQATALGDQDLFDMASAVGHTASYRQTISLHDQEVQEDTFVVLGRARAIDALESFDAAMARHPSDAALDNVNNQASAHPVIQNGSVQREPISRWLRDIPGYQRQAATGYHPVLSPVSNYPETYVSHDNSDDLVNISNGPANVDRDTQGAGFMFTTSSDR